MDSADELIPFATSNQRPTERVNLGGDHPNAATNLRVRNTHEN